MQHYIILCRSLTAAQMGVKVLENSGLYASVMRAPASLTGRGCGYGIRVRKSDVETAKRLLSGAGVQTGAVHALEDGP